MPVAGTGVPRLVVVGAGMAAVRLVEVLTELAPGAYAVTLLGDEPTLPYNRVLLSPVLAGTMQHAQTLLHDASWYAARGANLCMGVRATAIDRAARRVRVADGTAIEYDRLVLATGSTPIRLPVPGAQACGVCTYRDAADTDAMIAAARPGGVAVVIGGGLLGIEAAAGLAARGMRVTLVHLMSWLMERQLDARGGALLAQHLRHRGIEVCLGAQTQAVLTDAAGRARAVALADGRALPADLVVMAIGIRPNIALARSAQLFCRRGIVVSDTLQTFDPRIYAVGECAEHRGAVCGLVAPVQAMAQVCAAQLAGRAVAGYRQRTTQTRLKVSGVEVCSCGELGDVPGDESLLLEDRPAGVYRRVVLRGDVPVGAVFVGDASGAGWLAGMIASGARAGALRDALLFGPEAAAAAVDPAPCAAGLARAA